jgi:hypothetical protein
MIVRRIAGTVVAVGMLAVAALAAVPAGPARAAPPGQAKPPPLELRSGNLLTNPGFEEAFSLHGAPELLVADGWTPWFDERQARPEYKDEPHARYRPDGGVESFSFRVFHGALVQKFFTFSATHDAGFYQQVHVPAHGRLRFSIWVQLWSSDCDDPCVSPTVPCRVGSDNTHGTYRVQVGLDPTGGIPARLGTLPPGSVQWSNETVFEAYDRWTQLSVEATPSGTGDTVTVYTRGSPVWPVKHNDSYWDDARLQLVGDSVTPSPTATVVPTEPTQPPGPTATRPPGLTLRIHLPVALRNAQLEPPLLPTTTAPPQATATVPSEASPTGTAPPQPSPTATPTAIEPGATPTPSPSATAKEPGPTPTPTPSAIPPPPGCQNVVTNGDFETGDLAGWQAGPPGPAMPEVSGAELAPGGGDYSLRVGLTAAMLDMAPSWSWALQTVMIPTGITTATLRLEVRPLSLETGSGDWQMVALRDAQGAPLKLVYWQPGRTAADWAPVAVRLDAAALAGRTVHLLVETYNDGDGAPSALMVDNLRLDACRTAVRAHRVDGLAFPDQADIRIDYPIRAFPGQENFNLPNSCSELEFESVLVRNAGSAGVDVGGWTLEDLEGHRFEFPPFSLGPGHFTRVWTKSAADSTDGSFTDVYWNRPEPVWNNAQGSTPWDVAVIKDTTGTERARRGYP